VDAQVHDPPGEPTGQGDEPADPPAEVAQQPNKPAEHAKAPSDQANERKGLRALFRNAASADATTRGARPAPKATAGRGETRLTGAGGSGSQAVASADRGPDTGITAEEEPSGDSGRSTRRQQTVGPLVSRSIISPQRRADPRLRVWATRAIVALALYIGFTIWHGWRYGLTAAVVYAAADSIFRSKTTVVVPASVRITSAQRFTRRRLKFVRLAGYHALHARTIPGTKHVIDHVVVGPAGVFTFDSQRLDRRLPLRMIGGMLYHGRASMERRLDHARIEAGYAKRLIENELGQPVAVRPAMVVYGPNTSWMIMRVKGVDVFDGHRVGKYFRRQSSEVKHGSKAQSQERLSAERIEAILAAADRALPTLT
jgi:hypothetical protein